MTENQFPIGWDAARVQGVIAAYDAMAEDELAAADDAAADSDAGGRPGHTLVAVPHELLPAVRELLAAHARD